MQIGEVEVQTKESPNCLAEMLHTKLTFWKYIRRAADKTMRVTADLASLMANTGSPKSNNC